MVTEGIEPSTVALLAQRSNQLSYATFLTSLALSPTYTPAQPLYIFLSLLLLPSLPFTVYIDINFDSEDSI